MNQLATHNDERSTIHRARAGDERALRELYDVHVDRVYRLAFRMSGDDDLARDATQEAFVRAFRRLDQFRGDAAFSTWMHRVTTSVTLNLVRRRKRHANRERELKAGAGHAAPGNDPPDPHVRDRLHSAVDALPEIYRTVFLMHDLEGYRHQDIAAALDVAVGTSKARLSRAREKLRDALSDLKEDYAT